MDDWREKLEEQRDLAAGCKAEYDNAVAAVSSTQDAAQQQRIQRITNAREDMDAAEQSMNRLQKEVDEKGGEYNTAIEEWRGKDTELRRLQEEAKFKQDELNRMKQGEFDRVGKLHSQMPALLDALRKQANQFESTPIGPLALNISIKPEHEELRAAIEQALGGRQLLSFIVSSKKDEGIIRNIIGRMPNPRQTKVPHLQHLLQITIRKYQPRYNVESDLRPQGRRTSSGAATGPSLFEAPTLIDVLDITNPDPMAADTIYNYLCDSVSAVTRMVFKSRDDAERVTYACQHPRAEGVACADYGQPGRKFYKRGQTSGSEPLPIARMMLVRDKASATAQLKADVNTLNTQLATLKKETMDADKLRKQLCDEEKQSRKELKRTTEMRDKLEHELNLLQVSCVDST